MPSERRLPVTYVLPIRAHSADGLDELTDYLRWLATRVEDLVVVDGSGDALYAEHARRWTPALRHVRPHDDLTFVSGKVNGVVTGLREAAFDRAIVADDDVRYGSAELVRMCELLEDAHLVCPQNYFAPMPWHAIWDTGRTLVNRAFSRDLPGTLGVRRDLVLAMGGYDGDVLFENLELVRTVKAARGRVVAPLDLFVRRLPPTSSHFLSQRVRQAYDEFARPGRMIASLAVVPAIALAPRPGRAAGVLVALCATLAEVGRRRAGGRRVFPPAAALAAPAWAAERAVCAWLAVGARVVLGGVPYGGAVITRAANPMRRLRARALEAQAGRDAPR